METEKTLVFKGVWEYEARNLSLRERLRLAYRTLAGKTIRMRCNEITVTTETTPTEDKQCNSK